MNHKKLSYTTCQQEIIALLQDKGWSLAQLARRSGTTPQIVHNHLINNRALTAEQYIQYKSIITGVDLKVKDEVNYDELEDMLDDAIALVIMLKQEFNQCLRDKLVDTEEYKVLSAKRNVLHNKIEVFISRLASGIDNR